MKHLGDICKINGAEIEPVDCITGGSPCQDLSIAGKRAGLAGERSGLFMEQVRIVKEMRDCDRRNGRAGDMVRPRFLVWENVPGAFSSNGGEDFHAVLEEIIHIAEPTVSVPRFEGKWTKAGAIDGDGWSIAWRTHDAQYWGVPQRRRRISVVADFGGQSAGEILFERKSLPGDIAESGASGEGPAEAAEAGASYAVRIRGGCDGGGKGALVQTEKSGTLGTGNDQTIFQGCITPWDCQSKRIFGTSGEAPTLQGGIGGGVNNPAIFCVCAVDCRNFCEGGETNGTLQAKSNGGVSYNLQNTVRTGMIVRRFTPMECERLQGFPDGWTDIGEWIDDDGRTHKQADAPRYKALGNSIALPFWYWILRRMAIYLPEGATLGSLFDGIGGFPLCWESIHGKGTARWASEIEKFPMAVTKLRFPEEA